MPKIRKRYEKDWLIYLLCSKCKEFKELNNFNNLKSSKCFWKWSVCKECLSLRWKQNRENNKEIIKQKRKEYYYNNIDKVKLRNKIYRDNHKEQEKHRHELYKEKYPDKYHAMKYNNKKKNRLLNDEFRIKDNIRNNTWRYARRHWIKFECCICNSNNNIQLHHPDYSKPFEIVPCCRDCHMKIHKWIIDCPQAINLLSYLKK